MRPIQTMALAVVGLAAVIAQADTIYVCWDGSGDYLTIQEGIDAAVYGDMVIVRDGVYVGANNRDLDFSGKQITVCSENGPENCIIDCEEEGRGFYFHSGEGPDSIVEGLTITNGSASRGGGIYCYPGSPTLTNCTVNGNSSRLGGGVYCYNSSPMLTNCTISGNTAYHGGGGVRLADSNPTFTNCILWGDTPQEFLVWGSGTPVVTYCDVEGGWPGEGNIDADPIFAFADDVHLMPGSPCIDTGANDPPGGLPADDPDGNPRPLDGDGDAVAVADVGAYEFNPAAPSIALSPTVFEFSAPEGGHDPADQTLSLRNCGTGMLNWEITGQPAWLTVSPSAGESDGEVDLVTLSVDVTGLAYGSYPAWVEVTDPQAVNSPREVVVILYVTGTLHVPDEYPTIEAAIDGASDGDEIIVHPGTYNESIDFLGKAVWLHSSDGPEVTIIDATRLNRSVVSCFSGEGPDTVLDGFTITGGSPNMPASGGGMSIGRSSPTVMNCTFIDNHCSTDGGGMSIGESRSATVMNCKFIASWAGGGGGVACYNSSPTVTGCLFVENTAHWGEGGGMSNSFDGTGDFSVTVTNCTFSGNTAGLWGGGMSNFTDNGGGNSVTVTNCTFSGNTASQGGGGMYSWNNGTTVINCVLWGDSPDEITGNATVAYCNVQGGHEGEGNIDADPLFVTGPLGEYYLSQTAAGQPADSPCLDAGSDTAENLGLDTRTTRTDQAADSGIVDMGYHFPIVCLGDLNDDEVVDIDDLLALLAAWGNTSGPEDINGDGIVDVLDLLELLSAWGPCL